MLDEDVEISNENIRRVIDINEIKTESKYQVLAAVEQCRFSKPAYVATRDKWYQKYSLSNGYCKDSEESEVTASRYQIGEEISSLEAVNDPDLDTDFRPRVYDNITKQWTLLDSGACISCTPKDPGDKIDPTFRLRAVNGHSIPTFGTKKIEIRIGRKQYSIEAIKTDINQQIIGWDFFSKYNLGLEWECGELFLTDKKAKIRSLLKFVKIDSNVIKRVESVDYYEEPQFEHVDPQGVYFETECMKMVGETNAGETIAGHVASMTIDPDQPNPIGEDIPLGPEGDPEYNIVYEANARALAKLSGPFADLVKKYPKILQANFKTEPASDIYHRIETTGDPFKSKMRPLLASSEKSEQGRKAWEEMEKLGVIERVKQNTVPLHLVRKPSGKGWRVCADFRLLNQQTKSDNYPLPLLRSFQSKIKGSKVFSTIDLKSAFHHLPIHPDDVSKTCVLSPWGGHLSTKD